MFLLLRQLNDCVMVSSSFFKFQEPFHSVPEGFFHSLAMTNFNKPHYDDKTGLVNIYLNIFRFYALPPLCQQPFHLTPYHVVYRPGRWRVYFNGFDKVRIAWPVLFCLS